MSKYVPRLENYYLDIITVQDGNENAIGVHEYPNSRRNEIEHLGGKTPRYTVKCVFTETPTLSEGWNLGRIVEPSYDEYFFFIDMLKTNRENLTFTHPDLGEIKGKVQSYTSDRRDEIKTVYFDFTFLAQIESETVKFDSFVIPEQAEQFRDSTDNLIATYTAEETAAVDTIAWTAQADLLIDTLDDHLYSVTSQTSSIINQINYGTSTPGLVLGSINSAIDRIVETYAAGRNAPATFINNLIVGVRGLVASLTGVNANRVLIMGASRVSYEAGAVLDQDDANNREIGDKGDSRSFDINGNYKKGEQTPKTLTLDELDALTAEVKKLLNDAIQTDRDQRTLQIQASELQRYINSIKFDRERIDTVFVELQPMHVLTLQKGYSHQYAENILALNPTIKNPNFVQGDVKILVQAVV